MADTPPGGKAAGSDAQNVLTRKVGPLPVWLWGLLALGAWYWYEHYGPGAASSGTAGQVQFVEQAPSTSTPATAFAGTRETAPGGQSLDKWAKDHGTTAGAVTTTTEEAAAAGKLDAANHTKFAGYLQHGTARPMPRGLVFYAPAVDASPEQPATASEDPSAGTGGSTSPAAIAAAQAITPGTGPRQSSPPARKEPAKKPADGTPKTRETSPAGTGRWRSEPHVHH